MIELHANLRTANECYGKYQYALSRTHKNHTLLTDIIDVYHGCTSIFGLVACCRALKKKDKGIALHFYGGSSHGANLTREEAIKWLKGFVQGLGSPAAIAVGHFTYGGRFDFHVLVPNKAPSGLTWTRNATKKFARPSARAATIELNRKRAVTSPSRHLIGNLDEKGKVYYGVEAPVESKSAPENQEPAIISIASEPVINERAADPIPASGEGAMRTEWVPSEESQESEPPQEEKGPTIVQILDEVRQNTQAENKKSEPEQAKPIPTPAPSPFIPPIREEEEDDEEIQPSSPVQRNADSPVGSQMGNTDIAPVPEERMPTANAEITPAPKISAATTGSGKTLIDTKRSGEGSVRREIPWEQLTAEIRRIYSMTDKDRRASGAVKLLDKKHREFFSSDEDPTANDRPIKSIQEILELTKKRAEEDRSKGRLNATPNAKSRANAAQEWLDWYNFFLSLIEEDKTKDRSLGMQR